MGLVPDELLLVHAGKLEPAKKTDSLLRAFAAVPELKAKLAVIGSIPVETQSQLRAQMDSDSRVIYLGWKNSDDLMEYLCAADLYCQPGKVSAIMQNAVCAGCPILLYPHSGYVKDYDYGNMLWVRDETEITAVLQEIACGKVDLRPYSAIPSGAPESCWITGPWQPDFIDKKRSELTEQQIQLCISVLKTTDCYDQLEALERATPK